jgi:hypothetical protein
MKSLLAYLILVVLSYAVGACAYLICRRFPPNKTVFSLVLLLCFIWVGSAVGSADSWYLCLLAVLGLAIYNNLGAWGHRMTLSTADDKKVAYRVAFTASILSFVLGFVISLLLSLFLVPLLALPGAYWLFVIGLNFISDANSDSLILIGIAMLLLTPSWTPFLIWRRQRSKTAS